MRNPARFVATPLPLMPITIGPEQAVAHAGWTTALASVLADVLAGPCVVHIVGPAGTGKTLLIEMLARLLRRSGIEAQLQLRGDGPVLDPTAIADAADRYRIVIIDEADRISAQTLQGIRSGAIGGCAWVLASKSEPLAPLNAVAPGANGAEPVTPRTSTVRLAALAAAEVRSFVDARLGRAGLSGELLSDGAVAELARRSAGVPRVINMLLGAALFLAHTDEKPVVDREHVEGAAALRNLDAVVEATAPAPAPAVMDSVRSAFASDETVMLGTVMHTAGIEPPQPVHAPAPIDLVAVQPMRRADEVVPVLPSPNEVMDTSPWACDPVDSADAPAGECLPVNRLDSTPHQPVVVAARTEIEALPPLETGPADLLWTEREPPTVQLSSAQPLSARPLVPEAALAQPDWRDDMAEPVLIASAWDRLPLSPEDIPLPGPRRRSRVGKAAALLCAMALVAAGGGYIALATGAVNANWPIPTLSSTAKLMQDLVNGTLFQNGGVHGAISRGGGASLSPPTLQAPWTTAVPRATAHAASAPRTIAAVPGPDGAISANAGSLPHGPDLADLARSESGPSDKKTPPVESTAQIGQADSVQPDSATPQSPALTSPGRPQATAEFTPVPPLPGDGAVAVARASSAPEHADTRQESASNLPSLALFEAPLSTRGLGFAIAGGRSALFGLGMAMPPGAFGAPDASVASARPKPRRPAARPQAMSQAQPQTVPQPNEPPPSPRGSQTVAGIMMPGADGSRVFVPRAEH